MLNFYKKYIYFHLACCIYLVCFYSGATHKESVSGLSGFISSPLSGYEEQLFYPLLVKKFYQLNDGKLLWFSEGENSGSLRKQLISILDTSIEYEIINKPYHYPEIMLWLDSVPPDSVLTAKTEKLFTDAAIAVFKDIYQGYALKPAAGFDAVSPKYSDSDHEYLLDCLTKVKTAEQLSAMVLLLEPHKTEYLELKKELRLQKAKKNKPGIQQLAASMNYFRRIHHFNLKKCIIINIASAYLRYYENDSLLLKMKVIVGKPSTPTPLFAAYFNEIILYPYWYVPRSIILNEFLPLIKRNPSWLDEQNMQVIDGSGKIINHLKLNWSSYHSGYFPYMLRQSTGCDNALGVIKFNINSPYGVYLHDTNNKTAFFSESRFYSHGCIRIEDPFALANHLLNNKLDTAYLQSCFKDQQPVPLVLEEGIPVFTVYITAEADPAGKIRYYRDIYKLLR